jgi:hypothetical protein
LSFVVAATRLVERAPFGRKPSSWNRSASKPSRFGWAGSRVDWATLFVEMLELNTLLAAFWASDTARPLKVSVSP